MPKKGKAKSRKEISPLSHKKLQKVFEQCGFEIVRQESTHVTMKHPDVASIVTIPIHTKDVHPDIIRSLLRKADISKSEYFELLDKI
jgi:predicted RNA binding protein YcfA (HicA-like mRNA interferase family)